MLRPAMSEMLDNPQECYAFVVAVAKRAREIADEAEEEHDILEEKPVRLAVDEFAEGKSALRRE
ncbi:MAG TPA: DNA-directed RNA polymerase subunit omega [Candidatus Fimivivens faecavium]|nr:DNA-directed RNA polymerase subunit omega [Candidatus Fimivivens faecavium]